MPGILSSGDDLVSVTYLSTHLLIQHLLPRKEVENEQQLGSLASVHVLLSIPCADPCTQSDYPSYDQLD